jgi:hypothetical protein
MTYRAIALLCTILLLSACGKSENQSPPKLFQDQREALDKAKAVGPALQQQSEEERKQIEQQTK